VTLALRAARSAISRRDCSQPSTTLPASVPSTLAPPCIAGGGDVPGGGVAHLRTLRRAAWWHGGMRGVGGSKAAMERGGRRKNGGAGMVPAWKA